MSIMGLYASFWIDLGAMLAIMISANLPASDAGARSFAFGALFPVCCSYFLFIPSNSLREPDLFFPLSQLSLFVFAFWCILPVISNLVFCLLSAGTHSHLLHWS